MVKETVHDKLGIEKELLIERAHRVGKSNASTQNGKPKTRTIVAKFSSWKQKEKILKIAREKRLDGLFFYPDFSQRTLNRRADQVPQMLEARAQGLHPRSTHYQRQAT